MIEAKQNRRAIRQEAIRSGVERSRAAGNKLSSRKLKAGFRTKLDRELAQKRREQA